MQPAGGFPPVLASWLQGWGWEWCGRVPTPPNVKGSVPGASDWTLTAVSYPTRMHGAWCVRPGTATCHCPWATDSPPPPPPPALPRRATCMSSKDCASCR